MEELKQLKQRLEQERPAQWDELPDLALYMDQVVSYMPRQLIRFDREETLTAAMVNNYIKDGLVPRAEGKRYGRAHLGFLTAVCALKKVLPVRDIRTLLEYGREGKETEYLYNHFGAALDEAFNRTAQSLDADADADRLPRLALAYALRSYADQLACQRILDIMSPPETEPEKNKEKKK